MKKIHMLEVVKTAAIVPLGIEACAFFKFPERFDPAMIPNEQKEGNRNCANYFSNKKY